MLKKQFKEIKQIRREEADMLRVEETTRDTVATAAAAADDDDLAEELEGLPTWEDAEDEEAARIVAAAREGADTGSGAEEDVGAGPARSKKRQPTGTKRAGDDTDTDTDTDDEDVEEGRKTGGLPRRRDGLPAGTKRIRRPWYNKIPSMTHEWYFLRPSQDDMTGQIDLRSAVDMDINTSSWLAGLGQPIDSLAPEDDMSRKEEEIVETGSDSARGSGDSARGSGSGSVSGSGSGSARASARGRSDDRGDDSARGTSSSSSTAEVVDMDAPETSDVIEAQVVDENPLDEESKHQIEEWNQFNCRSKIEQEIEGIGLVYNEARTLYTKIDNFAKEITQGGYGVGSTYTLIDEFGRTFREVGKIWNIINTTHAVVMERWNEAGMERALTKIENDVNTGKRIIYDWKFWCQNLKQDLEEKKATIAQKKLPKLDRFYKSLQEIASRMKTP